MEEIKRLLQTPAQSYFLFGPRGTGKTTWLKSHYPKARFINLLDPATYLKYSTHPEYLVSELSADPSICQIVIDEIQKLPVLLDTVHLLMEENKDLQFILTGSSSRKLKREGVDLLAGRAILKYMNPFTASELQGKFNIQKAMETGTIPLIHSSKQQKDTLSSYIALYIQEEVQHESLVRNISQFHRFLEAMTYSHGQVLNLSNISRECGVPRKTLDGYIQILEDLNIGIRLPVFNLQAKRKLITQSKFYFFDAGVFNQIRPKGPLSGFTDPMGASLEGLVHQHLKAYRDYSTDQMGVYYWRSLSQQEVDFVVYGENVFLAIEVKNTLKIRAPDLKPLKIFKKDYPEAKAIFLYRGADILNIDGIHCLPAEKFLLDLRPAT